MTPRFSWLQRAECSAPNAESGAAPADRSLSATIRTIHRAFSRAMQARVADHGVSIGQWFFLRVLWEEDGLTQRELSQRVGMMEPTTVTALNGMERRGLVQRVRNPHDRRKVNIFLTPKGRGLRDALLQCATEVGEQAVRGIPPADVEHLLQVLQSVLANLAGPQAALPAGETAPEDTGDEEE